MTHAHNASDAVNGEVADGEQRPAAPPVTGIAPLAAAPPSSPARRARIVRTALITGTLAVMSVAAGPPAGLRSGLDPTTSRETLAEDVAALPTSALEFREREDAQRRAAFLAAAEEADLGTFADAEGVALMIPSGATAMVGFHESLNPAAIPLVPHGDLEEEHTAKEVPTPADVADAEEDTTAIVLPTRQRPGGATSAVDIAVPEGEPIVAPLSGVVESVSPYFLYGQHPDVRIDVVPDGRPDLRVVIIHVSGVAVEPGDRLTAGETPLAASATPFPFASQIDRFVAAQDGAATPHIHIEVNAVG